MDFFLIISHIDYGDKTFICKSSTIAIAQSHSNVKKSGNTDQLFLLHLRNQFIRRLKESVDLNKGIVNGFT